MYSAQLFGCQNNFWTVESLLRIVMTVYTLNPLQDSRWAEFLQRHPAASVFHTRSWLEALRRTYGYEPIVFTTASSEEELKNGVVFFTSCSPSSASTDAATDGMVPEPIPLRGRQLNHSSRFQGWPTDRQHSDLIFQKLAGL